MYVARWQDSQKSILLHEIYGDGVETRRRTLRHTPSQGFNRSNTSEITLQYDFFRKETNLLEFKTHKQPQEDHRSGGGCGTRHWVVMLVEYLHIVMAE
jgi:hypothetical protein